MDHLFATTVQIYRLTKVANRGAATRTWMPLTGPGARFTCRLDLNFVRPGKDAVPPAEAGKAPDRVGVMLYKQPNPLRASDRIKVLSGPNFPGTFEIRAMPDPAQDYATEHHMEVGVYEVAQQVVSA